MEEQDSSTAYRNEYPSATRLLLFLSVMVIICGAFVLISMKRSRMSGEPFSLQDALAAVEQNPGDASLRLTLGNLYNEQGQYAQALEAFAAAHQLATDNQERAVALMETGDVYQFGLREPQKALAAYKSAEALEPTGEPVGQLYGKLFCLCCNFKELWKEEDIVRFAEMQAEFTPGTHSTIQLSIAYAIKGNKAGALGKLASVKNDPSFAYEGWNIACTYSLLGDNDAALANLDRYLQVIGPLSSKTALAEKLAMLRIDNTLSGVRQDPRFEALIARYEAQSGK